MASVTSGASGHSEAKQPRSLDDTSFKHLQQLQKIHAETDADVRSVLPDLLHLAKDWLEQYSQRQAAWAHNAGAARAAPILRAGRKRPRATAAMAALTTPSTGPDPEAAPRPGQVQLPAVAADYAQLATLHNAAKSQHAVVKNIGRIVEVSKLMVHVLHYAFSGTSSDLAWATDRNRRTREVLHRRALQPAEPMTLEELTELPVEALCKHALAVFQRTAVPITRHEVLLPKPSAVALVSVLQGLFVRVAQHGNPSISEELSKPALRACAPVPYVAVGHLALTGDLLYRWFSAMTHHKLKPLLTLMVHACVDPRAAREPAPVEPRIVMLATDPPEQRQRKAQLARQGVKSKMMGGQTLLEPLQPNEWLNEQWATALMPRAHPLLRCLWLTQRNCNTEPEFIRQLVAPCLTWLPPDACRAALAAAPDLVPMLRVGYSPDLDPIPLAAPEALSDQLFDRNAGALVPDWASTQADRLSAMTQPFAIRLHTAPKEGAVLPCLTLDELRMPTKETKRIREQRVHMTAAAFARPQTGCPCVPVRRAMRLWAPEHSASPSWEHAKMAVLTQPRYMYPWPRNANEAAACVPVKSPEDTAKRLLEACAGLPPNELVPPAENEGGGNNELGLLRYEIVSLRPAWDNKEGCAWLGQAGSTFAGTLEFRRDRHSVVGTAADDSSEAAWRDYAPIIRLRGFGRALAAGAAAQLAGCVAQSALSESKIAPAPVAASTVAGLPGAKAAAGAAAAAAAGAGAGAARAFNSADARIIMEAKKLAMGNAVVGSKPMPSAAGGAAAAAASAPAGASNAVPRITHTPFTLPGIVPDVPETHAHTSPLVARLLRHAANAAMDQSSSVPRMFKVATPQAAAEELDGSVDASVAPGKLGVKLRLRLAEHASHVKPDLNKMASQDPLYAQLLQQALARARSARKEQA